MQDKYKIAFISGMIAGFFMDIGDYLFYFLFKLFGLKHILHAEYMIAMILKGVAPENYFELISGQLIHILFTGILACFYIFVISFMRAKNNLFRGWLMAGVGIWFSIFVVAILFKVKLFTDASIFTVIADFFTASTFGILTAYFYSYFRKKYRLM